ncbi:palmitoyltransferase ZDHHC15-like [Paramuricea clavata]|uniref:Palmitoyltransferase n=1 Tax=Paramuricea clavata TaxID=317549 RepID=A0A6S7HPS5_PARCT|nr:palmitoyltransferase ZDHHC15-like [Paramuricea clavata]
MGKFMDIIECLLRAVQWFPVLVIFSIVVWSYYAYVVVLCVGTVDDNVEKVVYILFYHVFFVLFVWSYWKTILTSPGRIPLQFHLSPTDQQNLNEAENPNSVLETIARKLPVQTLTHSNTVRYCEVCHVVKPDRSHHCSMCKTCRLKMDHHCPWVNNCVGFRNYKFFLLFLFHAILYTFFIAMTTLQYFIKIWTHISKGGAGRLHILFLFFISIMFSISLWTLLGYHIYLVTVNRSTLESMRPTVFRVGGADKHGFNLGARNNIIQVFGKRRWLWCLPIYTSVGDGVVYPLREDTSPERLDLLNERGKWMDESDEEEDNSYTYVETIDETQQSDRAIVRTPDVVTFN